MKIIEGASEILSLSIDLYYFDAEETRKAVLAEEKRRIGEENRRQLEQRLRENEMSNAQEVERLKTQHEEGQSEDSGRNQETHRIKNARTKVAG